MGSSPRACTPDSSGARLRGSVLGRLGWTGGRHLHRGPATAGAVRSPLTACAARSPTIRVLLVAEEGAPEEQADVRVTPAGDVLAAEWTPAVSKAHIRSVAAPGEGLCSGAAGAGRQVRVDGRPAAVCTGVVAIAFSAAVSVASVALICALGFSERVFVSVLSARVCVVVCVCLCRCVCFVENPPPGYKCPGCLLHGGVRSRWRKCTRESTRRMWRTSTRGRRRGIARDAVVFCCGCAGRMTATRRGAGRRGAASIHNLHWGRGALG